MNEWIATRAGHTPCGVEQVRLRAAQGQQGQDPAAARRLAIGMSRDGQQATLAHGPTSR
jgi:hypothetical protein